MTEIEKAILINKFAYEVERNNPHLTFFEVNERVVEHFSKVECLPFPDQDSYLETVQDRFGTHKHLRVVK